MKADSQHWTTKDGRVLLIADMEDRHLVNTIRMLRRNVEVYRLGYLSQMWRYMETAPDGAYMACEDAERQTEEMSADEFLRMVKPCYSTMLYEAEQRGLIVPPVQLADVTRAALIAVVGHLNKTTEH